MSEDDAEEVTPEDVAAAREEVIEALARSAEMYGAKRSYGRLYGILYFADGPLSLDDLAEESSYAKSTVSTAMNTLERFHLVQRRSKPGEGKRAFFEGREDFWYVFQQFLDQQVRREIQMMTRALEAAEMVLEQASEREGVREGIDPETVQQDLERVRDLQQMYDRSEALIDAVTSERLERLVALVERLRGSGNE